MNSDSGKPLTNSNVEWHYPQSDICREEEQLRQISRRAALETDLDPIEKLRLKCLSRGAVGILNLAKVFRRMDWDDTKLLNQDEFISSLKKAGLGLSDEEAIKVFEKFNTDYSGSISLDKFLKAIRPPMAAHRRELVEQAFRKLDKSGSGAIGVKDIRREYSVLSEPRYQNGDQTAEFFIKNFFANFEADGAVDGKITLEEFMDYYNALSVSIEHDSYFDLMMRQTYKM